MAIKIARRTNRGKTIFEEGSLVLRISWEALSVTFAPPYIHSGIKGWNEGRENSRPSLHIGWLFDCDFHQMRFWIVGEGHGAVSSQTEGVVGPVLSAIRTVVHLPVTI